MNGFELKMIKKNTKPMLWKRFYVPGGITFTQLSFIMDEMFRLPQDSHFGFEFYSCKSQISERNAFAFKRGKWEYDHFDADKTYIDDYLGTQPWFSYYRNTGDEEAAFRVEIEERLLNSEDPAPELVKYVTLKNSNDVEYWDNLNEVLEKKYFVRYEDDPARLKHEEIRKELETGRPFTGSRHPVSAPLEEGDASVSRALDAIARNLIILTGMEEIDAPKGNKKLPDLVPARIMEKMAWVQRCDYAVTKLYGACRVDEFCKLCKTSPYLDFQDNEIEELFDALPDQERTCVRSGNRYVRKALIEKGSDETLREWHRGKKISYPTDKEINDLWETGYPASDPVYVMAKKAFMDDLSVDSLSADEFLRVIFDEFSYGGRISELVPLLEKEGLKLRSKKAAQDLAALLVMLNNNTRMALHKGNSPADISSPRRETLPFDASASFNMPGPFGEAGQQEQGMRPASGSAKRAPKIYPNDSCPCGSGKKYKKCCGRK